MKFLALISALVLVANSLPFEYYLSEPSVFYGKQWVVLIASSNTWDNYRHQADVYNAYQLVRKHGIPEENIIVFHYDDIAQNQQNPTKGIVINEPGGHDVYKGVPKDYTGNEVTPKNFLGALTADNELELMGKKILKSGPNDHVFIFFAYQGAPDLIAFPSDYLYGEDLIKALKKMHKHHMYSKLVLYLDGCESGSIFDTILPKNISIYATTAANPYESSYACFYDKKRETFLGNLFSFNWIKNSDKNNSVINTLEKQVKYVRSETNLSHVQEYGDLSIASLPLNQFQGSKQSVKQINSYIDSDDSGDETQDIEDVVDSGEVTRFILIHKYYGTTDPSLKTK